MFHPLVLAHRAGTSFITQLKQTRVNNEVRLRVCYSEKSSMSSDNKEEGAHRLAKAQYFGEQCKQSGPPSRPFIIGVAGGTASGKTSLCEQIIKRLQGSCGRGVLSISQDCFYKDLTPEEQALANSNASTYNFDHPDAFDFAEILSKVQQLRAGTAVDIPIYDFVTAARCDQCIHVDTADIILFDGILAFYDPEVRALFDLKIFVDVDADTRLARRVRRDINQRGRTVDTVLDQYERTVKPSFDSYIAPTKKHADLIIPRGVDNIVAIELLWQNIQYRISQGSPREVDGDNGMAATYDSAPVGTASHRLEASLG